MKSWIKGQFIRLSYATLHQVDRITMAMPTDDHKIRLNVPFNEKDQAKALGATWDAAARAWFIPARKDRSKFKRWLPMCDFVDGQGWVTCGAQNLVIIEGSKDSASGVQKCTNCGAHIPFGFN